MQLIKAGKWTSPIKNSSYLGKTLKQLQMLIKSYLPPHNFTDKIACTNLLQLQQMNSLCLALFDLNIPR
jgi:hypothetical protein